MDLQQIAMRERTQQLLEVLATLSYRSSDLKDYLNEIAVAVSQLIGSDWSIVTVCEGDTGKVVASSQILSQEITYQMHGTLNNIVVQSANQVILEDVRLYPDYPQPPQNYLSYFGMPLRTLQGQIIGTICSFNHSPRHYTSEEIHTVALLAERAAVAIDNYRLYQEQQQFNQRLEQEIVARTTQLQVTQAQLVKQEQLAAIGEFAAMIVHELKNPMTTVMMGLERFGKIAATPNDRLRAELALSEVQRLKRLLTEILLYAKPQSLNRTELELNDFIPAVIQAMQAIPQVTSCQVQFESQAPTAKVSGDRDKLQQALMNVIQNACEADPDRGIVRIRSLNSDLGQVCIEIHNYGNPIPPDYLPHLMEPFYSTKSSGTGLGLAIVKRIVEAHGGSISIQSALQLGTIVSITLPCFT
ncbi:GAF domain-containing sensor histidine kinase [Oscillatoria sp. FACHB-1406]|uniref:GAF domain-containing sensor histidine kinase n=1 Tax=Oscillatoria sp. FACHB-1406 TaxID=2692846 RepID=UPI0016877E08|nr:GAF domain-containing sensor histidine kinase [Oscillatoria sp. FACHB-1406]MBD2580559.1 GAF domain-containing protein [Oscillatoria sp. FACHB-1406]